MICGIRFVSGWLEVVVTSHYLLLLFSYQFLGRYLKFRWFKRVVPQAINVV